MELEILIPIFVSSFVVLINGLYDTTKVDHNQCIEVALVDRQLIIIDMELLYLW